jgi:hypothetical protein
MARPSVGEPGEHLGEAPGLHVVEPRGGLVEQQHLRPGGQRPPELDQAGLADGEGVGAPAATDPRPMRSITSSAWRRRPHRFPPGPCGDLGRRADVVVGGHGAEDLEPLEGAAHAQAGPPVGWRAGDVVDRST